MNGPKIVKLIHETNGTIIISDNPKAVLDIKSKIIPATTDIIENEIDIYLKVKYATLIDVVGV